MNVKLIMTYPYDKDHMYYLEYKYSRCWYRLTEVYDNIEDVKEIARVNKYTIISVEWE